MTTNELSLSAVSAKPQILIKRRFKHSTQKVWEAIATKEGLSHWLMETEDFELKIDQAFRLKTKRYGKFDGIVNCRIIAIQPREKLTFTWSSNVLPETIVSFELNELSEEETVMTLSHYGFKGFGGWIAKTILGRGWKKLMRTKLENYLSL